MTIINKKMKIQCTRLEPPNVTAHISLYDLYSTMSLSQKGIWDTHETKWEIVIGDVVGTYRNCCVHLKVNLNSHKMCLILRLLMR